MPKKELFTTVMRGFDKEEVLLYLDAMVKKYEEEKADMRRELNDCNARLAAAPAQDAEEMESLRRQLSECRAQLAALPAQDAAETEALRRELNECRARLAAMPRSDAGEAEALRGQLEQYQQKCEQYRQQYEAEHDLRVQAEQEKPINTGDILELEQLRAENRSLQSLYRQGKEKADKQDMELQRANNLILSKTREYEDLKAQISLLSQQVQSQRGAQEEAATLLAKAKEEAQRITLMAQIQAENERKDIEAEKQALAEVRANAVNQNTWKEREEALCRREEQAWSMVEEARLRSESILSAAQEKQTQELKALENQKLLLARRIEELQAKVMARQQVLHQLDNLFAIVYGIQEDISKLDKESAPQAT